MSNAPHVHSVEETKANISKVEHNASGQGPGPSGKKGGPPTGIEGGSGSVLNTGGDSNQSPKHKGAEDITGS
jgi:hypothetical protein